MYLPTEGLFAEILRRPGLVESIQREFRVAVAGPTTLAALLNSLQMGFRTLAIEKRSGEVWTVLGEAKTEFRRYGDVLDRIRAKLLEATSVVDKASARTRAIERKLQNVEQVSDLPVDALTPPPPVSFPLPAPTETQ
jgi:DNA recombination protein RmuC